MAPGGGGGSETQWICSVQPEKFRKNWSPFWGGPLFPGRIGRNLGWMDRTLYPRYFLSSPSPPTPLILDSWFSSAFPGSYLLLQEIKHTKKNTG